MSTRRLLQVHAGLLLFGVSIALMARARLGLDSWDVLHQGIARRTGLPMGWVINGVAVLVLLAWWPLRQRPGYGTVANVVMVGFAAQAAMAVLPPALAIGPLAHHFIPAFTVTEGVTRATPQHHRL